MVATSGDDTAETKSGAAKGIGIGAAFGGVGGLLVGLAGLSIPGIGPIVAAGPIASALAGAGIGAVAGGTIGALRRLGVPEQDAHYYAEGVRRGGVLVTADANDDDEARIAADIMRNHDAADIEQLARTWRQEGWQGFDEAAGPYVRERSAANDCAAGALHGRRAAAKHVEHATAGRNAALLDGASGRAITCESHRPRRDTRAPCRRVSGPEKRRHSARRASRPRLRQFRAR